MRYYIWTEGCQMNIADSERMGSGLEQLGLELADSPKKADVIVLNTCVVRQSAEDKAVGMLTSLKPWRQANDGRTLAVMGCMVGPQQDALKKRFPFVDVFMRPQQFEPLLNAVADKFAPSVVPDAEAPAEQSGTQDVTPANPVRPEREAVEGFPDANDLPARARRGAEGT